VFTGVVVKRLLEGGRRRRLRLLQTTRQLMMRMINRATSAPAAAPSTGTNTSKPLDSDSGLPAVSQIKSNIKYGFNMGWQTAT